jgi:hypothetical protein
MISQWGSCRTGCGLRLLNHRFPTRIRARLRGRLGLFVYFNPDPPTLPFPGRRLTQHPKNTLTQLFSLLYSFKNKKNKLTNIHREKKIQWGPTCCVTHGVYSGKRLNCQYEECGGRLTLTSSVYICKLQLSSTINYRHSVINSWLIRN